MTKPITIVAMMTLFEDGLIDFNDDVSDYIPSFKNIKCKGKVDEISEATKKYKADLVIFNHDLSPSQERNLEKELRTRVLDRTGLILDIFASRATSHIGKMQVELAQLNHLSTRLVRGWSHLERQKGGIGLRGPGETQLETDRRLIANRNKSIKKRKTCEKKNVNEKSQNHAGRINNVFSAGRFANRSISGILRNKKSECNTTKNSFRIRRQVLQ